MLIVLLVVLIALAGAGIGGYLYIKSMMPNGDGNNDIIEGYYLNFKSDAPLETKYSQLGRMRHPT